MGGKDDKNAAYERDQVFMFSHIGTQERSLLSIEGVGHRMAYAPGIQDLLNHQAVSFFRRYLNAHTNREEEGLGNYSFTRVSVQFPK